MSTEIKPYIDDMDLKTVLQNIEQSTIKHENRLQGEFSTELKLAFKYGALQAAYENLHAYCKRKIKDLPQ